MFEEQPKKRRAARPSVPLAGPERAASISTPQGSTLDLSFWDVWFCLVAVQIHDGDLDRLARKIKQGDSFYHDRDSSERKSCHLRDLKRRLDDASVSPSQVVSALPELQKAEKRRALKKVMESCDRPSAWSEPMKNTPRSRRWPHALRGHWDRFPVSPRPDAEEIGARYQSKGFYSESMSYRIARTLDRYADKASKLLAAGKAAEAQALLRGWMTVIVELMERADDSGGSIGMSFGEGFQTYLKIPLDQTGIADAVFFPDLLDFLIWEDYGLTYDQLDGYFGGLTPAQADLCIEHLRREVKTLAEDDLEYQSEGALTLLGKVIVEQERFFEFEGLAQQMGARHWERIIRLADKAMKSRMKPLAIRVFEAALTEGSHLAFLTKKFDQLKAGKWNPDPKK